MSAVEDRRKRVLVWLKRLLLVAGVFWVGFSFGRYSSSGEIEPEVFRKLATGRVQPLHTSVLLRPVRDDQFDRVYVEVWRALPGALLGVSSASKVYHCRLSGFTPAEVAALREGRNPFR